MRQFQPVPEEDLRGLHTLPDDPIEVPVGFSPDNLNVDFLPGRVFTRPGTLTQWIPDADDVRSMAEFVRLDPSQRRLLAYTARGALYKETGSYATTLIDDTIMPPALATNSYMGSVTAHGRQFMGFGIDGIGQAAPRHYDDTTLNRVSQSGPGDPPNVADDAAAGSIAAGPRRVRVFFRTNHGYWTGLSPYVEWTAAGEKKANVTAIPTGPPNVVARVLCFTPACNQSDFYFLEDPAKGMVINDNTTTTSVVDFSEIELIAGTNVSDIDNPENDLLDVVVLPAMAAFFRYNDRMIGIGARRLIERYGDQGFLNMYFDGGIKSTAPNVPCGWAAVTGAAAFAVVTETGGVNTVLKITGDGASPNRLRNAATLEFLNQVAGKNLYVRVRLKRSAGSIDGSFHIYLSAAGVDPPASHYSIADVGTTLSSARFEEFSGLILPAADNKPTATWQLRVGTGGGAFGGTALTAGASIFIDQIEIYTEDQTSGSSVAYVSLPQDPESYLGTNGFQKVAEDDGQVITSGFQIRDSFYYVKERAVYKTTDTGAYEPAFWPVSKVSSTVGTPSLFGVAQGDGWVLIAGRAGLHFYTGGDFVPIQWGIKKTWERISWSAGDQIWVSVNTETRQIKIGVPLDGASQNTHIIYGRYRNDLPTDPEAIDWSIWDRPTFAAAFSERSDGHRADLVSDQVGQINEFLSTQFTDVGGTAIDSYYQTAFFGSPTGKKLFGYLTLSVGGRGDIKIEAIDQDDVVTPVIENVSLDDITIDDTEGLMEQIAERLSMRIRTTKVNSAFNLRKFVPRVTDNPMWPIRGVQG